MRKIYLLATFIIFVTTALVGYLAQSGPAEAPCYVFRGEINYTGAGCAHRNEDRVNLYNTNGELLLSKELTQYSGNTYKYNFTCTEMEAVGDPGNYYKIQPWLKLANGNVASPTYQWGLWVLDQETILDDFNVVSCIQQGPQ